MADAQIRIDGRIATDPRYNQVNGKDVANLRVLAGRSKKLDDGTWETLSQTAYDVAFWNEHAHLVGAIEPNKGDSVIVTGSVTGVESYAGQNGESLSIKVSGDGVRVFPKQQQSGGGGFGGQQQGGNFGGQQAQPSGNWGNQQQSQQSSGWGQNPGSGNDEPAPF
ncbi:MAG: single-stranded DNA-binding protein [Brevibacterium aurantiacum]